MFDEDGNVDEDATNFEVEVDIDNQTKGKSGKKKKGKRKAKLPYKEAKKLYETEKAKLICTSHEIVVKTGKSKIGPGAAVETRKKPHRKGKVVSDKKEKRDGKWKWKVEFEDGTFEYKNPQSLNLMSKASEYKWTVVKDHIPPYIYTRRCTGTYI